MGKQTNKHKQTIEHNQRQTKKTNKQTNKQADKQNQTKPNTQ